MSVLPRLTQAVTLGDHKYLEPMKRIHDGPDVQFFLQSRAYRDITTFILQLNRALVPRNSADGNVRVFYIEDSDSSLPSIAALRKLISSLDALITEAPPDTGPRRFGNISFRTWYKLVEDKSQSLLEEVLPEHLHASIVEIRAYLLGSFGSPQRLDYGTGHELSFIAYLASLWKIGYFEHADNTSTRSTEVHMAATERRIVTILFESYLSLIRKLIITYNLEPAGSHGVWGLDDNSFLPYLFGSAQLCPAIPEIDTSPPTPTPISGSLPSSPDPSIVTQRKLVEKEASSNLYFAAIKFIYDIKRGPFWEHSPMLFDISGIKDGWGKINKGLVKMYDAEVLGKFPVVQHFPFGSLLRWERDPDAKPPQQSTHTASQPPRDPSAGGNSVGSVRSPLSQGAGISAPLAAPASMRRSAPVGFVNGVTQAPWAKLASDSRTPLPLHSQALRSTGISALGANEGSLRRSDQRPVTAAMPNESTLAEQNAEAIPAEEG